MAGNLKLELAQYREVEDFTKQDLFLMKLQNVY